jgi:glutaredoxin 3
MKAEKAKLYVTNYCPFCVRAKNFLIAKGIPFDVIDLTHDPAELERLKTETHWKTVPMIFINDEFIGGYTDMLEQDKLGKITW